MLTTWTRCSVCKCVVAHLDQPGHDEWHARLAAALAAEDDPPVLEVAS